MASSPRLSPSSARMHRRRAVHDAPRLAWGDLYDWPGFCWDSDGASHAEVNARMTADGRVVIYRLSTLSTRSALESVSVSGAQVSGSTVPWGKVWEEDATVDTTQLPDAADADSEGRMDMDIKSSSSVPVYKETTLTTRVVSRQPASADTENAGEVRYDDNPELTLQSLAASLRGQPVMDQARVSAIREAIAQGRFVINHEAIADNLLREMAGR